MSNLSKGIVLCVPFATWAIIRVCCYILFSINCGDHMERAGTANSIDLAKTELRYVVDYAKSHNLTDGYTSVLYNRPTEDIAFWFNNMQTSLNELENVKPTATELEKSNILIKLRETVHSKDNSAHYPWGLEIYPHNIAMAIFGFISLILSFIGLHFLHEFAMWDL